MFCRRNMNLSQMEIRKRKLPQSLNFLSSFLLLIPSGMNGKKSLWHGYALLLYYQQPHITTHIQCKRHPSMETEEKSTNQVPFTYKSKNETNVCEKKYLHFVSLSNSHSHCHHHTPRLFSLRKYFGEPLSCFHHY